MEVGLRASHRQLPLGMGLFASEVAQVTSEAAELRAGQYVKQAAIYSAD